MGRNTWSQKQIDYLKENFKNITDEELNTDLENVKNTIIAVYGQVSQKTIDD